MTTKKKLIIAISAFALVVIASVVSIVAVLAARDVSITSSFNIQYNVEHIYGSAKVEYKQGTGAYTAWKNSANETTTTFNGSSAEEFALAAVPFTLTESNKEVTIKFSFQKTNSDVENFSVKLDANVTKLENITIKHGENETPTTALAKTGTATMLNTKTVTATGTTWYSYYVTIAIAEPTQDAEFTGTLTWSLNNING